MKKFEFHPFDRVLVRSGNNAKWVPQWYSHKDGKDYVTMDGSFNLQCIPYEGNEDLYDTSDPYVEEWIPKDGDFLTTKRTHSIFICNGITPMYKDGYERVLSYICYSQKKNKFFYKNSCWNTYLHSCRPATEEEKQLFLSKFNKIGKDWDAEKKEVVEWKWKPNSGEEYFFPSWDTVNLKFETFESTWTDYSVDSRRKERNFVFRTEEECQTMCDKLNESIK